MKKLSSTAFWLILLGIVATLASRTVDLILSKNRDYSRFADTMTAERLESFSKGIYRFNFVSTIIFALICVYFIYRLIANKNEAQGQKYITFLFVVNVIVGVINLFSVIMGNYMSIAGLVVNFVIVAGCIVQKNYHYTRVEHVQ